MITSEYLSMGDFSGYVDFEQVKSQNFYESEGISLNKPSIFIILLKSYNTIVGCIDYTHGILYHFGKAYSRTTSKQLTMYINEKRGFLFNEVIYLNKYYNWNKFKASYLRG